MPGRVARLIVLTVLTGHLIARAAPAPADGISPAERRSGRDFMAPETQAMQSDDASNPGMLWVLQGEALWEQKAGAAGRSCADCHGPAASMRGVAARYPALDAASGKPVDLAGRINQCRSNHQDTLPLVAESDDLLALTTFVAHQSRGLPIAPPEEPRLDPFRETGRQLFNARMGQLDLACADCHDDRWNGRLAGSAVTQGHPTAYPLYRLEWQGIGSLQRRLRNCMVGVRAEPFAAGSDELIALELYLMQRAAGMEIETPGIRP
ncbi:sulfur-oxidizing protein SoxA [Ancylobacter sp. 3268]|uniref:sulfur oxidation c-type cytochrome SoxA n=1 Tax=Ancylobacter sp. 3268 TaxID=2817752 RepID=UPI0028579FC8|nr:sulfur oxidation c-type cytochrome SoxA [Ancylobacter sp. 3268]MDR6952526.1 sulfur-oxidizing protein SoxA [Ancylobacter sp. 3268]